MPHYIHPSWKVYGTRTGRWSSAEPNAQNVPEDMRNMFIARPGMFLASGDYSQLELRIVAMITQDEVLLDYYARGLDVHVETARALFGVTTPTKEQRHLAKTIEYGVNYNHSDDVSTILASVIVDYPHVTEAVLRQLRKMWFKAHPAIYKWQRDSVKKAKELGYVEEYLTGLRQYYYDDNVDANEVLNFPIQGFAGALANKAILALDKEIRWDAGEAILLQVHDEIVLEGPDVDRLQGLLQKHMPQTITLNNNTMTFPINVHSGVSWDKLKG